MYDVLVLGSGVAGLTTALHAARRGLSVLVLTKGELSHSATRYAQGGVAAALAAPDTPDLHLADTLTAGAGLCDRDAVRILVTEGPDRVRELARLGAHFDTEPSPEGPELLLAREGGHSLARVVHAGGDATGAEIERALVEAVNISDAIEVREGWFAIELLAEEGVCSGVLALHPDGHVEFVRATDVVLSTGGAGQCFAVTTNPTLSTGDGIALALKAGVACADLEFVQFHPTALHTPLMPRPLISEALRGEGAVLRDVDGVAFMTGLHPLADLAPRDIVSRAVYERMQATGEEHVWLDATMIDDFEHHFPTIWFSCLRANLDPTEEWLPVSPAAHYLSGGVVTDLDGATTLQHLWACGEVACSGVHGANRLASNSLLDGLVFGRRVVEAILAGKVTAESTGAMTGVLELRNAAAPAADPVVLPKERATDPQEVRGALQRVMFADCGVVRDADGLRLASETLNDLVGLTDDLPARSIASYEVLDLLRVSRAIVASAAKRTESRGSHTRREFPAPSDSLLGRFVSRGGAEPEFVALARGRRAGPAMNALDPPRAAVRRAVAEALAEDLGILGDITSIACIDEDQRSEAMFVARSAGVLAGTAPATETFRQLDDQLTVEWYAHDGDPIAAGAHLGRVSGSLRAILTGERTALNFLCHCSGIATLTHRYVLAAHGKVRVLDTRKTVPGLRAIQRAAVRAGGGFNHRDSLSDAVLIKDNHVAATGVAKSIERARSSWPGRTIEVECDAIEQVVEALDARADRVLLDNMSPEQVRAAVELLDGAVEVEVSGGVTLETISGYAESGADFVSVGALTHSVTVFDIGLDML